MPLKSVEPRVVLPRPRWPDVLRQTVVEVFAVIVRATVSQASCGDVVEVAGVTGIVGIGGAIRANLIVRCSHGATARLASQMLGIAPDDPEEEKAACDALGEICNIVAGYFKAKIGLGDACKLSVPMIVTGREYRFRSPQTYERLEFPVAYEGEVLRITLEIAR